MVPVCILPGVAAESRIFGATPPFFCGRLRLRPKKGGVIELLKIYTVMRFELKFCRLFSNFVKFGLQTFTGTVSSRSRIKPVRVQS